MSIEDRKPANDEIPFGPVYGATYVDSKTDDLKTRMERDSVDPEIVQAILDQKEDTLSDLNMPNASLVQTKGLTEKLNALATLQAVHNKHVPTPIDLPSSHPLFAGGIINQEEAPRPFVGDLPEKFQERPETIPTPKKDPMGVRHFIGDEFPRMFLHGQPKVEPRMVPGPDGQPQRGFEIIEKAKPALWSHFHQVERDAKGKPIVDENGNHIPKLGEDGEPLPITSLDQLKGQKLNVNIATKVPEYMKTGKIAEFMEGGKDFKFKGQEFEEVFSQVSERTEKIYRRYGELLEKTVGIKLDIRRDDAANAYEDDDINISICGFANGEPRLAGFANFPPAINEWENLAGYGFNPGFLCLNQEYCERVDDDLKLFDLVAHEMGHFLGMVHPHDLGAMKMPLRVGMGHTIMAYTDGTFTTFTKDGKKLDIFDKDLKQLVCGAVDHGLRHYWPDAPKLNAEKGSVYNMGQHAQLAGGENWHSNVVGQTKMVPAVPILDHGEETKLIGSAQSEVIDTEPGYSSRLINPMGMHQHFAMVEGHIAKVYGVAGDNVIFPSSKGDQEIFPGPGSNQIHIYPVDLEGEKTIHSTGFNSFKKPGEPQAGSDKLVIHQDVFKGNKPQMLQDGDDLIIDINGKGRIVLKDQMQKGKGVNSIVMIDDQNKPVKGENVSLFTSLREFEEEILKPIDRHIQRILKDDLVTHFAGGTTRAEHLAQGQQGGHEHAEGSGCCPAHPAPDNDNKTKQKPTQRIASALRLGARGPKQRIEEEKQAKGGDTSRKR